MYMNNEQKRTIPEKLINFSKKLDVLSIMGGLAVGVVNPALGGLIVGGSIVTLEAGRRIEQGLDKRKARKLGKTATKSSFEMAA